MRKTVEMSYICGANNLLLRMIAMRKKIGLLIWMALAGVVANGATPFRDHRYDEYKVTPLNDSSIVFYGNSITNMHEWWEAFGCDSRIANRGASGAFTQELIDNVGSITSGQPAKVFIGIGTNDLGNEATNCPDSVAGKILTIVDRIRSESPRTEVYVQSILPSTNGLRTEEIIKETNGIVERGCEARGVEYIDLYDDMAGMISREISYDGLHPTAKGYQIWCEKIAPIVGANCAYPAEFEEDNGGIDNSSFGMRFTHFSAFPVKRTDTLIIGDEMIHGGEWHELLGDSGVKNRGTGWGYGGLSFERWNAAVNAILGANGNKEAPRRIVLYAGTAPLYAKGADPEKIAADYRGWIENIRGYAPASSTRITVMSLIPRNSRDENLSLTKPMNELLRQMAGEMENVDYLDIYSDLAADDDSGDPEMIDREYLTGKGYLKVASRLKED